MGIHFWPNREFPKNRGKQCEARCFRDREYSAAMRENPESPKSRLLIVFYIAVAVGLLWATIRLFMKPWLAGM
jgi:hypothetical protein